MTFLEKARKENKHLSKKHLPDDCPEDYGLEAKTECINDCKQCWNREMPNTEAKAEILKEVHEHFGTEESDISYVEGLEHGRNEVWEFLKVLIGFNASQCLDIYDTSSIRAIINKFTPQEAIAKLKAYEEQKIEVGDVVTIFPRTGGEYNAIIVRISSNNYINVFYRDGIVASDIPPELYKKTGKHLDISSILEQIGE